VRDELHPRAALPLRNEHLLTVKQEAS
jgi:hypothetical protein